MGTIRSRANSTYANGPSTNPTEPIKSEIRRLFGEVEDSINAVATGIVDKNAVNLHANTNITLSGEQTIDGVLTSSSSVICTGQSAPAQNGVYTSNAGAWTRRADSDTEAELLLAAYFVDGGVVWSGYTFKCTTPAPITVGSTALSFVNIRHQTNAVPNALDLIHGVGDDIASASTIDLDAATGDYVTVTGNTTINAVTLSEGRERFVLFSGSPTITASETLIGDNGAADVQILPGDMALFKGEESSVRYRVLKGKQSVNDDAGSEVVAWASVDATGRAIISVHHDGSFHTPTIDSNDLARTDDLLTTTDSDSEVVAWAAVDETGRAIISVHHDGTIHTAAVDIDSSADPNMLPLFPQEIHGIEDEEVTIYADSLLTDRTDGQHVRIFGHGNGLSGYQRQGKEQIVLRPDQMINYPTEVTGTGKIGIRALNDQGLLYGEQVVTVRVAEKTPLSGGSPVILGFGDSIWQQGAVSYLKYWLGKWGYTPSFIGTLGGDAYAGDAGASSTRLGEGKPGHWFADFTYRNTDRIDPLPAGQEATYAAMDVANRRLWNTFLQTDGVAAADGGAVNAADKRNGQYIDFQRYVGRHPTFFTATPTMLVFGPGTNDLTHLTADVATRFKADFITVCRRWKAAYPSAPIVYFLPQTQFEASRQAVWPNYVAAIKAILDAQSDCIALGINVRVIGTWAMASVAADYDTTAYSETPDAETGSVVRGMPDGVHGRGSTQASLFKHLAYGIACAATGV